MRFITPFSLLAVTMGNPSPVVEDDHSSEVTDVEESEPTYPAKTYLRRPKWFTPALYATNAVAGGLLGSGALNNHPELGFVAAGAAGSFNLLNAILYDTFPDRLHSFGGFLTLIGALEASYKFINPNSDPRKILGIGAYDELTQAFFDERIAARVKEIDANDALDAAEKLVEKGKIGAAARKLKPFIVGEEE